MSFSEDISLFFGDLAQTASLVSGTSTSSISLYFSQPSAVAFGGAALVDDPSAVLAATVSIARGDTLVIGTATYTVRMVERIDDGQLQRVALGSA